MDCAQENTLSLTLRLHAVLAAPPLAPPSRLPPPLSSTARQMSPHNLMQIVPRLQGQVCQTILRGTLIFSDGEMVGEPTGRVVLRGSGV